MDVRQLQDQIKENKTKDSLASSIKEMKETPVTPEEKKKTFASRREVFNVKYLLDNGEEKVEKVNSVILDSEKRQLMNRLIVQLAGGLNIETLPGEEQGRITCLARIAVQVENPSDWLINTCGEDLEFCYHIAQQLVSHETRYFRYGDGESEAGERKPRFSIDSVAP